MKVPPLPIEWKFAILMMISGALLMSGLFDTFWIQVMRWGEVPREVRAGIAVLFTLLLAGAAAFAWYIRPPAWWRRARRAPWDWTLKGFLILAPVFFIVGAVNRWPLTYLIGDLFLLTIFPLTYFTMVRRPLPDPRRVFSWIYGLMILVALVSAVLVVYHNLLSRAHDKMSLDAALGPIFYILLKNRPGPLELLLLPLLILASLLTTKRSTWAGILMVALLAFAFRPGVGRPLRLLFAGLSAAIIVHLFAAYQPDLVAHSFLSVERRWEETMEDLSRRPGSDLAPDAGGRAGEVYGVFDTIRTRQNPLDWATGLGLGAIVQARGGRERHHVHSTPAAFLVRTGVAGVFLWLSFSLIVWWQLAVYLLRTKDRWLRTQFAFWLGIWSIGLVFSLKSLAFWGAVPAAIQVAYFLHLFRVADAVERRGKKAGQ